MLNAVETGTKNLHKKFEADYKTQGKVPASPEPLDGENEEGQMVTTVLRDPWQEWRTVREEDEESDVDLGEEEKELKQEQLNEFEDLQLRVMSVIEAERKNKKAIVRNHKSVVAAHKKREADLAAE